MACGLAAALAACTTLAPEPAPPRVDLPGRWAGADASAAVSTGKAPRSLALWWQRFDDPLLNQLVDAALNANTRVAAAQATLQQAVALRDVAAAGLSPSLGLTASAQRGMAGGQSSGNRFATGLQTQWTPDVFGANRRALDAREASRLSSAATLGDVQVQVATEVALNYLLLRSAQARLAIASDNLDSQAHTLQIADWRRQAGLVSTLDSEQARAATEQTRALLPARQTAIEQTRHALAVLTGQPPAALAPLLGASAALPGLRDEVVLGMPADLLLQRADLRAARHEVTAAWARVGQAEAQRWPSFSLDASLGLSALTIGALTQGTSAVGALVASLSAPLFDGGALQAQVRVQQAALALAHASWRATLLQALKDVEDALAALRGDRQRLASLLQASDAATRAAMLASQRYGSGLVDFQTVLETQRNQLSAQDGVAAAQADIAADQVRLFQALGGGWNPNDSHADPAGDAPRITGRSP